MSLTDAKRDEEGRARVAAFAAAMRPPTLWRSLAVMIVVGVALNFINQGVDLLKGAPLDWKKAALTFPVPFLVATYSAYGAEFDIMRQRDK